MRIGSHRYTVDYGHLALITFIAAAVVWYLLDTRSVSLSVNNLLLVQPTALFALAIYLFIVPQCFRRIDPQEEVRTRAEKETLSESNSVELSDILKTAALSLSLGLMVFLLDVIGFDAAIFLFTIAAMAVCGERRPLRVLIFSAAVTLVAIYGFRAMISYPMPTLVL